jgi:hypothetical protein
LANGKQRELFGYGIAAKGYAFFVWTPEGNIRVVKASAHGLGFLYPPKRGHADLDTPLWVVEAWEWILRETLGLINIEPSWFNTRNDALYNLNAGSFESIASTPKGAFLPGKN